MQYVRFSKMGQATASEMRGGSRGMMRGNRGNMMGRGMDNRTSSQQGGGDGAVVGSGHRSQSFMVRSHSAVEGCAMEDVS